jgi:ribosome recycling factor
MNTLRAGGANPSILDRIQVEYYGTYTPLQQLARVSAMGSEQLIIEPFDKAIIKDIEREISQSDLNLTPTNDGSGLIRINIPPLTEERRKELAKKAKVVGEESKVAIRNIRRDQVDIVKKLEKDSKVGKDDSAGAQEEVQKITDGFIKKIDELVKNKENDMLKL